MDSEYVELHCHSYCSLLRGASSPEDLAHRAHALGYPALALTDHDGLYGAVRFWQAARAEGIKPIVGAELTLADGHHLTMLAETQRGYANLCRLISLGQLAGQKGQPQLSLDTIAQHAQGLLCLSGCVNGAVSSALLQNDTEQALGAATTLKDIFGHGFWIELQDHCLPSGPRLVAELVALAGYLGVGYVCTNNVHHAERSGQRLYDVLTCIRHRVTLPEALAAGLLASNSEQFLKPPQEMALLFRELPQALRATREIAERCTLELDFVHQQMPSFTVPEGYTTHTYLRHLCEEGLARKYQPITARARTQLDHELAVIERAGLAGYFLTVWDIVRFAREQGIRCQGRGSAANSIAAYVLGITPVDPLQYNLLFERFLSEGSHTMPDIDVDFAADRREEVIQYVYQRYGEQHVAMVCNVVTFRARSAVRDVAKALCFPPEVIDRTAKALDTHSTARAAVELREGQALRALAQAEDKKGEGGEIASSLPWQTLVELLQQIDNVPRHLSIHVGGMLITAGPLVEIVPVERATMPGRVVVQWDKDSVEDAGLIKIDLLSLRTLDAVEEAQQLIAQWHGVELDLERLPMDDPAVYAMLQRADTVGTFQVESRAQAQMLPRLKPTCFEDIVVEVALVRPGPIQGHMVHPYLRRRQGLEEVTYAHPAMEPALAETLGVILFQEQAIRVAVAVAGFSPAEADQLRRAMSRSRSEAAMAAMQARFLAGAVANGISAEAAVQVFQQLAGFAEFGFCKSHAAAFALVAYQTLYLKVHYPAEFFCGILNAQPMGFYMPEVVIGDARRHGVTLLQPDINRSQSDCTLEALEGAPLAAKVVPHPAPEASRFMLPVSRPPAIRLGLRYVNNLGDATIGRIIESRGAQPYRDLRDLCRRTHLPRSLVENLVRSGALDCLGGERRDLLWALGGLDYQEETLDIEVPLDAVTLPALRDHERLGWEYELLGLAPGEHIMQLYRSQLRRQGILSKAELDERKDGETVRVAGWMVIRQRPPTAKGHVFITLEDEEGLINLIVRPYIYESYKEVLRNAPLLWVEGRLQREGAASSVLVWRAGSLLARRGEAAPPAARPHGRGRR